jgi:hypothetical protein
MVEGQITQENEMSKLVETNGEGRTGITVTVIKNPLLASQLRDALRSLEMWEVM